MTELEALNALIREDHTAMHRRRKTAWDDWPGIEFEFVETFEVDTSRWSRINTTVIRMHPSGTTYGYDWEEGLTEMQDGGEEEPGEAYEVVPVEVTKIEWRKKK